MPLHPFVIHFPIALSVIIPFVAIISFGRKRIKWSVLIALSLLYVIGSYTAMELGEEDEERVEKVVGHQAMHEHEEAGEKVFPIALVVLGLSIAGYFISPKFKYYPLIYILILMGLIYPVFKTGETGGRLVYEFGAAKAFEKNYDGVPLDNFEIFDDEEDEGEDDD